MCLFYTEPYVFTVCVCVYINVIPENIIQELKKWKIIGKLEIGYKEEVIKNTNFQCPSCNGTDKCQIDILSSKMRSNYSFINNKIVQIYYIMYICRKHHYKFPATIDTKKGKLYNINYQKKLIFKLDGQLYTKIFVSKKTFYDYEIINGIYENVNANECTWKSESKRFNNLIINNILKKLSILTTIDTKTKTYISNESSTIVRGTDQKSIKNVIQCIRLIHKIKIKNKFINLLLLKGVNILGCDCHYKYWKNTGHKEGRMTLSANTIITELGFILSSHPVIRKSEKHIYLIPGEASWFKRCIELHPNPTQFIYSIATDREDLDIYLLRKIISIIVYFNKCNNDETNDTNCINHVGLKINKREHKYFLFNETNKIWIDLRKIKLLEHICDPRHMLYYRMVKDGILKDKCWNQTRQITIDLNWMIKRIHYGKKLVINYDKDTELYSYLMKYKEDFINVTDLFTLYLNEVWKEYNGITDNMKQFDDEILFYDIQKKKKIIDTRICNELKYNDKFTKILHIIFNDKIDIFYSFKIMSLFTVYQGDWEEFMSTDNWCPFEYECKQENLTIDTKESICPKNEILWSMIEIMMLSVLPNARIDLTSNDTKFILMWPWPFEEHYVYAIKSLWSHYSKFRFFDSKNTNGKKATWSSKKADNRLRLLIHPSRVNATKRYIELNKTYRYWYKICGTDNCEQWHAIIKTFIRDNVPKSLHDKLIFNTVHEDSYNLSHAKYLIKLEKEKFDNATNDKAKHPDIGTERIFSLAEIKKLNDIIYENENLHILFNDTNCYILGDDYTKYCEKQHDILKDYAKRPNPRKPIEIEKAKALIRHIIDEGILPKDYIIDTKKLKKIRNIWWPRSGLKYASNCLYKLGFKMYTHTH